MKISKKWTLVLPVAAVLLLAAGCSSSSSSGKSSTNQTLNWSETSSIVTNDPSQSTDTVSFQTMTNTQEGIYRLTDKGQKPQLALAKKVTTSQDGMTYHVTLRNAKWSNGRSDYGARILSIVGSARLILRPKPLMPFILLRLKMPMRSLKVRNPASDLGIKATDKHHLTITLEIQLLTSRSC